MKQLINIKLVQFFLYEKREVRLGKTCGIFGANGSGKSSLLDAVQIVLFGGHGRNVSFNAQADESNGNKRTIRSYCLGQFGDAEDARIRQNARTYITLAWQDTDTGEIISTGVCIYSSGTREAAEVQGRYIVAGEIALLDHVEMVDGKEEPREWSTFRVMLQQRGQLHNEEVLFHESDRFVREVLFRLRGNERPAPSYESFVQAFRFALRMKFDRPVDSIVRHQVLEAKPIDIRRFRQVLSTVQELSALVKRVKEKLDDAAKMEHEFREADRKLSEADTWLTAEKSSNLEIENAAVEAAETAEGVAFEDLEAKIRSQALAKDAFEAADLASKAAATARDSHSVHTAGERLRGALRRAENTATERWNEFRRSAKALRAQLTVAGGSPFLSRFQERVTDVAAGLDVAIEVSSISDRIRVEFALRTAMEAANDACNELFLVRKDIGDDIRAHTEEVRAAKDGLERLKEGKLPLDPDVGRLKNELADHGIHTVPVCDVVQVSDTDWQPVIESYLGASNLQALLVEGNDEREAFRIYRATRNLYEVKLARQSRFESRSSPKRGSVAELIVGTNSAAINYLRSKFGDAQCAVSEEDCFNYRHALTVDGMHLIDGEITRLRLIAAAKFKMGVKVGSDRRQQIERDLSIAESKLRAAEAREVEAKALYDALIIFGSGVNERVKLLMVDAFDAAQSAEAEAQKHQRELDELQTDQYAELVKDAAEKAAVATTLNGQHFTASNDAARADEILRNAKSRTADAKTRREGAHQAYDEARAAPGCDAALLSKYWDAQGQSKLGEFTLKYQEHPPITAREDWRVAHAWISERVTFLETTELKDYDDRMDEALRTARDSFRNDVALALNDNIEQMRLTFEKMDEALAHAPAFSNGDRYRFIRKPRPAFERLLRFIKDVATYGAVEDLLGGAGELPPEFEELMKDKTEPGAGSVRSPLDDYREFFDFDVEVLRRNKDTGLLRHEALLSNRVGSGSGGEHRAPLYVIAGAALASAYRIQPGDGSGIRLIMLDEAFNKMDPRNIVATMRYFEELGLQMFAASTGEAQGTLNAFLDRYYDIMRDPDQNIVLLEGHDVSAEVRETFRSDLPDFHPELITAEVESMYAGSAEVS